MTTQNPIPARRPLEAWISMTHILCLLAVLVMVFLPAFGRVGNEAERDNLEDLKSLSIEELLAVEIVSASRQTSSYGRTPAAVYVITRDDIETSSATCIPELLRMAPGLQVARLDSGRWAVSARGFNSLYANKLLVLVDGRSVYNELFSGVYWELLDMPLDDIERIEVIRGPGGATWGANAVNGVINILTRDTAEDDRSKAGVLVGTDVPEWSSTFRYVHRGNHSGFRLSAYATDRGDLETRFGEATGDTTEFQTARARYDWSPADGRRLTVLGSASRADLNRAMMAIDTAPPFSKTTRRDLESWSESILARWESADADVNSSSWSAQAYISHLDHEGSFYSDKSTTYDMELQRTLEVGQDQTVAFGGGLRFWTADPDPTPVVRPVTGTSTFSLYSAFFQYEWLPSDSAFGLSVGAKVEHNDFTGLEIQPSLAANWSLSGHTFLWASVSRAVKTPDRGETETEIDAAYFPTQPLPTLVEVLPNPNLNSEDLIAYQVGIRGTVGDHASYDIAVFYHDYEDIVAPFPGEPRMSSYRGTPVVLMPLCWENAIGASAAGVELGVNVDISETTSLKVNYTYLHLDADEIVDGQEVLFFFGQSGLTPDHAGSLQLTCRPSSSFSVSILARYTAALHPGDWSEVTGGDNRPIDAVTSADLVLKWRPRRNVTIQLAGKDLLDSRHKEFYEYAFGNGSNWIPRRATISATFSF